MMEKKPKITIYPRKDGNVTVSPPNIIKVVKKALNPKNKIIKSK